MRITGIDLCLWAIIVMTVAVKMAESEAELDQADDNEDKVGKAPRCHRKDPDLELCLQRALQASLPLLVEGNLDRGLPSLQPLYVDKLYFDNEEAGLKLKLRTVLISGIANSTFQDLRANLDDYTVNVTGISPLVTMTGRYKLKFNFDGEKIEGKGKFQMNFTNLKTNNILHGVKSVREGQHVVDVHLDGDIRSVKRISVNFEGLLKGDKKKGEDANKLLNKKWSRLWEALKPPLDAAYAQLLSEISSKALASLPLSAIFDDV